MQLKSVCLLGIFCLILCWASVNAQNATLRKKLDALKQNNDLKEWLYERIDYVNANPQQLPYLVNTQKETWRQPANAEERIAWLTLLSTQGYDHLLTGDILGSINDYENAYAYFYKYKVLQFDAVEYIFKPLSNNYTRLGDYERAVFMQQKSLALLNVFDDADKKAAVYSNMAIAYYTMGNYPQAALCVAQGDKLTKNADIHYRLQNILADILYEQGQLQQAKSVLLQNTLPQKKPDPETAYMQFGAYTTLGRINLKAGDLKKAEAGFNTALQLADTWFAGNRMRERANIIAQLAKIQRLRRQPLQALGLLNKALQLLRINTLNNQTQARLVYGENNLVDIFREKALVYQSLGQDEPALENLRYALLATDKIRKEFADKKTKERLQQDGKELAETAIETALRLYSRHPKAAYLNLVLEIAEQTKARTLTDQLQRTGQQLVQNKHDTTQSKLLQLQQAIAYNERLKLTENDSAKYQTKINALKYDLSLLDKQYREQAAGPIPAAGVMLPALPDSLQVLEFFFGVRSLYAIAIKNRIIKNVWRVGDADSLRQQLNKFTGKYYHNGPEAMLNAPKEFFEASNKIYAVLFKNIEFQLRGHLCVVADDVLGYLSFDGLITSNKYNPVVARWPFLVRQLTITYAFSLNALITNKAKANPAGFSGLFVSHEGKQQTPIVAVKKEASAIHQLVAGQYLYNDEVNTTSFFNAFENSSVLHISTHAYLYGANKEPALDFGHQQLFLFELLARQHKPNLVVLSACRSGDGLLAKGEGIISLARGFSAIGTPATIAGLWNVNDDAVAQITAGMYKYLIAGQSTGSALHQAKLAWLNNGHSADALYLPYYWDSLILMGADEPVALQPAHNYLWLYGLSGTGLVALLALVLWRRNKTVIN